MLYLILTHDNQPLDGELRSKAEMLAYLRHADGGDIVIEFDPRELRADQAGRWRNVTEEMVIEAHGAGELEADRPLARAWLDLPSPPRSWLLDIIDGAFPSRNSVDEVA